MKLDIKLQDKLTHLISNAKAIGIEYLIIDELNVRGVGESPALMLIDPVLDGIDEIGSIGINRLSLFNTRISMLNKKNLSMTVAIKEEDNGNKIVEKFILKEGKTSIDFKCCRTNQLKIPKALKSNIVYTFDITNESLLVMSNANNAMKNDTMSFALQDGEVYFKLSDTSGDVLKHTLSDQINIMEDDAPDSFFFNYDKKVLLPLIKLAFKEGNDKLTLAFTRRGMVNLTVNDLNIYIAQEL